MRRYQAVCEEVSGCVMSLPVLLPGSCCPMAGLSSSAAPTSSPGADPSHQRPRRSRGHVQPPRFSSSLGLCSPPPPMSSRRRAGSGLMLPGRPLLSLGLLQLILGCCTVALSFGALSLSKSPQIRSSCPFWAGSSVILSGIIGLTTWKRPMILLVNLFVMLSVVCVLLNLAGFILGCQGAQFVSSVPSCHLDESQVSAEEAEEQDRVPDPEDFVPPAPPPSYFSTFYSSTPRLNQRMMGNEMIPLPHIYGSRFKGIEVFCPMEPPPPYEAVVRQSNSLEATTLQITDLVEAAPAAEVHSEQSTPVVESASSCDAEVLPGPSELPSTAAERDSTNQPQRKRSHSDPVIHEPAAKGAAPSCEAATQTELRPPMAAVTLRRALRARAVRSRPRSLIDYKSYIDTKLLVAKFLEEPSCRMTPDIQELVESIKTVLKSDEEHMDEAILSANFLDQVMAPAQPSTSTACRLPCRRYPGLLHLESCGDLSTFCQVETQRDVRRTRRTVTERPHSLIGVVRETVL
ncbi:endosomal transmembrane epsin interactor 1 isoform 2-T2 [Discoglossus pictus]